MRRWLFLCAAMVGLASCTPKPTPPPPKEPLYPNLPLQQVPNFMRGTLFERVRFLGLEPMSVYGYSLVVNLHDTGDSRAPAFVRDFIVKEILTQGFDSYVMAQGKFRNVTPDELLRDKRVAIVQVEGHIPVGARQGQSFDVTVRALQHNNTRSLAHGDLYQTDLSDMGLIEPQSIGARQQAYAPGGPIFVNPAYALKDPNPDKPQAQGEVSSLRVGTVLNGGVSRIDRPIDLQLRRPQASTARYIEQLISQRWEAPTQIGMVQGDGSDIVAKAENEGLVLIYVPPQYKGNWKHFLGVVSHLYINQSPEFLARKCRDLVEMAQKPGAPLTDISLCWEAMGEPALPSFEHLISDPDPDVAFAAARAAAFLGDEAARRALLDIALDPQQHNQVEAVRVLAELPNSQEVNQMIAKLLDSNRADVRIEAYRLLIANQDSQDNNSPILTYNINHRFLLDIVPSNGPPMVYATSSGVPRIAIMGRQVALRTPLTFTAMDMRLSITSSDGTRLLTMFYRDPSARNPEESQTHNDLAEILARLGGKGPDDPTQSFDLSFGDVVAVAEQMVAQHDVYGDILSNDNPQECIFQLEHPSMGADDWNSIPSDNREGRPQGEGSIVTAGAPPAVSQQTATASRSGS
jgi:hypothetical protein